MDTTREAPVPSEETENEAAGILIRDRVEPIRPPMISAFIWGGKVRPMPTLPFGRWKPEAA